jgi:outer membrane immunogenic protein
MKFFLIGAAAIAMTATQSFAQDWSGPYAGAAIGYEMMSAEDLSYGDGSFDPDGFQFGAFGGYNIQSNMLVYGIEAGLAFSTTEGDDGSYLLPMEGKSSATLRGRIGYANGAMLPYLAIGYTWAKFEADHEGFGDSDDMAESTFSGPTGAIGIDYQIAPQMFGRFEVS